MFIIYVYHCSMDTFKTLKYKIPISLYSLYILLNIKEAFFITPLPNSQFIYNASKICNTIREKTAKSDLSISICSLKLSLKNTSYPYKNLVLFMSGIIKRLSFFLIKKKIWGNKKDMSLFHLFYTFFMSTNEKLIYGWTMHFLLYR